MTAKDHDVTHQAEPVNDHKAEDSSTGTHRWLSQLSMPQRFPTNRAGQEIRTRPVPFGNEGRLFSRGFTLAER